MYLYGNSSSCNTTTREESSDNKRLKMFVVVVVVVVPHHLLDLMQGIPEIQLKAIGQKLHTGKYIQSQKEQKRHY